MPHEPKSWTVSGMKLPDVVRTARTEWPKRPGRAPRQAFLNQSAAPTGVLKPRPAASRELLPGVKSAATTSFF